MSAYSGLPSTTLATFCPTLSDGVIAGRYVLGVSHLREHYRTWCYSGVGCPTAATRWRGRFPCSQFPCPRPLRSYRASYLVAPYPPLPPILRARPIWCAVRTLERTVCALVTLAVYRGERLLDCQRTGDSVGGEPSSPRLSPFPPSVPITKARAIPKQIEKLSS